MTQIDASSLSFNLSMVDLAAVAFNVGAATPFSYSWQSDLPLRITAISYLGDITAGLAGSVHAVNILGDAYDPGLSIIGLDIGLTTLIDLGNDSTNLSKFWDGVLAGETTFILPRQLLSIGLMGDFVRVSTGRCARGRPTPSPVQSSWQAFCQVMRPSWISAERCMAAMTCSSTPSLMSSPGM